MPPLLRGQIYRCWRGSEAWTSCRWTRHRGESIQARGDPWNETNITMNLDNDTINPDAVCFKMLSVTTVSHQKLRPLSSQSRYHPG